MPFRGNSSCLLWTCDDEHCDAELGPFASCALAYLSTGQAKNQLWKCKPRHFSMYTERKCLSHTHTPCCRDYCLQGEAKDNHWTIFLYVDTHKNQRTHKAWFVNERECRQAIIDAVCNKYSKLELHFCKNLQLNPGTCLFVHLVLFESK